MAAEITPSEFEELYGATVRDLFGYVRRRAAGDAEDLVAEVYAVAWRRRSDLPPAVLRRAWLFGVARTLITAEARRHARERTAFAEAAVAGEGDSQPGASSVGAVVGQALAQLSEGDREILQLVEWEMLSPAELATALGVRPGTARVRLHRARQALARDPLIQQLLSAHADPDPPCAGVVTAVT